MESIGGYRIIRRLASGTRADVLLGHSGRGATDGPQLAAIKVFRSGVPDASIDAEISALSRLHHPHIVALLDLATGPGDVPILILQRLEPGGLGRLLADRGTLEPGEAVTILAPLTAAVMAMHRDGVTHGGIAVSAVLFDEFGSPTLCGFGAAAVVAERGGGAPAPAALDEMAGVIADIRGLTLLAATVLGRVSGQAAQGLRDWLAEQPTATELLSHLEERLFAFAEPEPVVLQQESQPDAGLGAIPHRFDAGAIAARESPAPAGESTAVNSIRQWLEGWSARTPEWLSTRLSALPTAVRSVRRRVWVVGGIGAAAAVVSFVMMQLPTGDTGEDRAPAAVAAPSPTESPASGVVAGDDPVAAARVLLELRARCLVDRSVLCLDAVHQPGSAAWQADAARIQDVQGGAELVSDSFVPDSGVVLIDRMGDTALVGLQPAESPPGNATASVLMIKTEAGWRIRGLMAGPAPLSG